MAEVVKSFDLDHRKVKAPYVRLAGELDLGQKLYKYDVRFLQPNTKRMTTMEAHSIEHLFATYLRDYLDVIWDVSPMGCMTGFYVSTTESNIEKVLTAVLYALVDVLKSDNMIAANDVQCGYYYTLNLQAAKEFVAPLIQQMWNIQETIDINRDEYPEIFE